MKIYEEKDNEKRTIQCSYCYNSGHNKRRCPHLKAHYLANKDYSGTEPMKGISNAMFSTHYQLYFGQARAEYLFQRHFKYAEGIYGEQEKKVQKKRRKPKCGFCKSEEHNRRNCGTMDKFVKILTETERNYRARFYDQIIVGLGFGIGAFVEYGIQKWEIDDPYDGAVRGLVTSFDPSSITIGNLQSRWGDYHTTPLWEINGLPPMGRNWGNIGFIGKRCARDKGGIDPVFVASNHSHVITDIIAPSPTTPDKDWFLGKSPAFDWVVKKRSLRILYQEYRAIIREFHPDGQNIAQKLHGKLDK